MLVLQGLALIKTIHAAYKVAEALSKRKQAVDETPLNRTLTHTYNRTCMMSARHDKEIVRSPQPRISCLITLDSQYWGILRVRVSIEILGF